MRHRCICVDFGFHVPECYYSDRSDMGGAFHCINCGAKPTHEVIVRAQDSSGAAMNFATRYCEEHRPKEATRIEEQP